MTFDTDIEYNNWITNPTPQNLTKVVDSMAPIITGEIQHYPGPKNLLRSKARVLTAKAIKTYSPTEGAALKSWVTGQLKPLYRYGQSLQPIRAPELAIRRSAEVNNRVNALTNELGRVPTDEEISDDVGISLKSLNRIRSQVKPVKSVSGLSAGMEDEEAEVPVATQTVNPVDMAQDIVYASLSPQQQAVFEFKTGYKGRPTLSNQEIARRLGMSPAAVTQISKVIAEQIMRTSQHVI